MLHGRLHRRGYRIEELQRRLWAQRRTHGLAHLGNFVDQCDQLVSVRGPRLSSSYAVPRSEERKRAEEDQLAPQHRELIVTDVDIHTCCHQPASEAQRSLKVLIVEIVSESELHQHERTRVFNKTGRGSSRGNPDDTRNHTRAVDVSQQVDMVDTVQEGNDHRLSQDVLRHPVHRGLELHRLDGDEAHVDGSRQRGHRVRGNRKAPVPAAVHPEPLRVEDRHGGLRR